ncbi:unnamed protein product, partial [Meganyctiphanes norvegica]
ELEHDEGKLQNVVVSSEQTSAVHIRITITAGYGHFCSIHNVSVTSSGTGSSSISNGPTKGGFLGTNQQPSLPSSPSNQPVRSQPRQVLSGPPDEDDDDVESTVFNMQERLQEEDLDEDDY